MHEEQPEPGGSESAARQSRGVAPRSALAQIREAGTHADPALEERIMTAALIASGELGYRGTTVKAVLSGYGGYRTQFYRHFASFEQCYQAGYAAHADALARRLLGACASLGDWRAGLGAALRELGVFACENQALARGLLVEVNVAGQPALERRKEVLERLSNALDSARRETRSRHSPPPLTAAFIVSGIDAAVAASLADQTPQAFLNAVPGARGAGRRRLPARSPE